MVLYALTLITDDHRLNFVADYGSSDLTASSLAFSGHSLDPPHTKVVEVILVSLY